MAGNPLGNELEKEGATLGTSVSVSLLRFGLTVSANTMQIRVGFADRSTLATIDHWKHMETETCLMLRDLYPPISNCEGVI